MLERSRMARSRRPRRPRPRKLADARAICTCPRESLPVGWPADPDGSAPERVVLVVRALKTGWRVRPEDHEIEHVCPKAVLVVHHNGSSRPRAPGSGRKRSNSPAVPWSAEMRQAREQSGLPPAEWTYRTLQAGALAQLGLRRSPV